MSGSISWNIQGKVALLIMVPCGVCVLV